MGGVQPLQRGLHVFYEEGTLYFAVEGHSRVKVPMEIPSGDYRPCISIARSKVRLWTSVQSRKRKIVVDDDEASALKVMRCLWTDRSFSDATVTCGSQSFRVHRSILAANSQFFARAFQSQMRAASDCSVVIPDADKNSVEALLRYLYTRDVGEDFDASALLPLAHRYEVAGLVDRCAAAITKGLREDNVVRSVAALMPFKDEESIKWHWNDVMGRIATHRALLEVICGQMVSQGAIPT